MIAVSTLAKSFGDRTLFAGVSLQLNPGERYGLVGANGSGKTTLLRILSGDLKATEGTVSIPKRLRIGLWPDEFDDVFFLDCGQRKSYDILLSLAGGKGARYPTSKVPGTFSDGTFSDLQALHKVHDLTLLFRCPPAWYVKSEAWDAGLALIKPPAKSWMDRWDKSQLDGIDVGWDWYSWISGWNSGGGHWNQNSQFAPSAPKL